MDRDEMRKLEQAAQRDMELLRDLPPVTLHPEQLARVQAAVVGEAERVRRAERTLSLARAGIGVAAAIGLALGLASHIGGPAVGGELSPEAALNAWAAAWDQSTNRVTSLLDEGWVNIGWENGAEKDADVDGLFESLDHSLDQLEAL